MKHNKIFRTLAALCTCLMLMGGFSVTAFAQGTDPAPTATPAADATNDSNVNNFIFAILAYIAIMAIWGQAYTSSPHR